MDHLDQETIEISSNGLRSFLERHHLSSFLELPNGLALRLESVEVLSWPKPDPGEIVSALVSVVDIKGEHLENCQIFITWEESSQRREALPVIGFSRLFRFEIPTWLDMLRQGDARVTLLTHRVAPAVSTPAIKRG